MDVINVFSPYGGELILEDVPGNINKLNIPENSVDALKGHDRSMYAYVPKSGCFDAKQEQVIMVLRNESSKESAQCLLQKLALDNLSEEKHCIILFPNPEKKWNYLENEKEDDDLEFLVRCFASLPKSKGKVAGFNGMVYYIGTSLESNALIALLAKKKPIECAAMMIGAYPSDFNIVLNSLNQCVNAWVYAKNDELEDYLIKVNNGSKIYDKGYKEFASVINKNNHHYVCYDGLNATSVRKCFDLLFAGSRRWRNDTYGTYQERTDFEAFGFVAHINDDSLGVNNGFKHTWFEYIPDSVKQSDKKVPLLFYFHGGGCVPLYGAEQSDWHRIAKKNNFIVVYPSASVRKMWNVWDDPKDPSDIAFVLALINHMKELYPIDEKRIYISGFSMGSMMTNTLACAYPDIFAAGAALNAQHLGYFGNLAVLMHNMNPQYETTKQELESISNIKIMADKKKKMFDYKMPLFQCSGLLDNLMNQGWPIDNEKHLWLQTINYWLDYNHIEFKAFDEENLYGTGLRGHENTIDGSDERFIHHYWHDEEGKTLYEFLVVKRMPHAVDLREIQLAYNFIKHFYRNSDGTLGYER